MSTLSPFNHLLLCVIIGLILHAGPALAFGAGNIASISSVEGQNWRHGDIEDTLLTILISRAAGGKKFSKLDVKRVYFGNWLRDYSQAVDVGTVKYVSAEAIRLILWVLGFMSFGYGTKEFEVTTERLGCYRPEEHIDNPKDYADNLDARDYDRRLRGPVDERRELSIDPRTGLKSYIASEGQGFMTSAELIRDLFGRCINLGRQYGRSKNKADLYEALRLLGTGCHCLEDYSAHSNYVELVLAELGERDVFPHVGRRTQVRLPGAREPVYPIVTGTFGGVDFLHSVMGEFSDKATQSEISELEGTVAASQNSQGNTSLLKDLLNQVPSGLFGGKDEAGKADELQMNAQSAQLQNTHVSPKQPEAWTRQLQDISKQLYPIIEWHDELMQSITETIEKIPILPALIDQLTEQLNVFIFSLIAPFILPVINQVKTELNTGSSEIIQSSQEKQLIVFRDDRSSDPTHSMLSKDHFSNVLNEPAGKTASQCLKWVVPQLMAAWDDERVDANRTISRIINGVFHHPALRDQGEDGASDGRRGMFQVVQTWWKEKDERERDILRDQLSREGVEQGRNHKPGVKDTGHGCGKPLGMPTTKTSSSSGAIGGLPVGNILGEINSALSGTSQYDSGAGVRPNSQGPAKFVGGGALGGIVGGLVGGAGGSLLGDVFGGSQAKTQGYQSQSSNQDGSYTQSYTETGYSGPSAGQQPRYGQAQYSQTNYETGAQREEFQRYEQSGQYGQTGYGQQVIRDERPTYGGGYEERTETRYEESGRVTQSDVRYEGRTSGGEYYESQQQYGGGGNASGPYDNRPAFGGSGGGYGRDEGNESGYGGGSGYAQREESGGSGIGGILGGAGIGGMIGGFFGAGGKKDDSDREEEREEREEEREERQEEGQDEYEERRDEYEERRDEYNDNSGGYGDEDRNEY